MNSKSRKEMKETLDKFVEHHQKKVNTWLDKLTFFYIFLLWTLVITLFGFFYYFFSTETSHLLYTETKQPVSLIFDHIYFSFITATTTGFGDIIPIGAYKMVSLAEVIFGLLLLAFVTSKFVSIKQNLIIHEIYDLSLKEKINRTRSSLLLARQKIGAIIDILEEKKLRRRDLQELSIHLAPFEDVLREILLLFKIDEKNDFTTVLDPTQKELIYHGIIRSFEKFLELLHLLNFNRLEWQHEENIALVNNCFHLNKQLFTILSTEKEMALPIIESLQTQNNQIIEKIIKEKGSDFSQRR